MHRRQPSHALDLGAARLGTGERDVLGDRGREQERLLRHPGESRAQGGESVLRQRRAGQTDLAVLRLVMPQQELNQRRLAGAGRPDHAEGGPGLHRDRHVAQRSGGRAIGEAHLAQLERAARHRLERAAVVDGRRLAQDGVQARPGRLAAFDQRHHPAGGKGGPDQLPQVHREGGQLAHRQLTALHQPASHGQRQHRRGGQRQADRRLVGRLPPLRIEVGRGRRAGLAAEIGGGARLQPERSHRAHAADGLLHVLVHLGKAVERALPAVVHAARNHPEGQRHERERQQRHQRQPPVQPERHHRHHQHQREGAVEAGEEGLAGGQLHRVDIVGGARHQVTRLAALIEARALQRQALVQPRAQLEAEPVGRGEQLQSPAGPQQVDDHAGCHQQRHVVRQRRAAERAAGQPVDHLPHLARQPHGQQRNPEQHQPGEHVGTPMPAHEAADQLQQGHGVSEVTEGRFGRAARRARRRTRPARRLSIDGGAGL